MKTRVLLLAALSLASGVPSRGQLVPAYWALARVTRVIDGDTYEVLLNSQKKRVRQMNVDCPESDQPFGKQATDSVKRLLPIGGLVLIHATGTDLYGRTLARIKVPRDGGMRALSLDSLLVVRGWAWVFNGGQYGAAPWSAQLETAVNNSLGLWKCQYTNGSPVMPKLWRSLNRYYKMLYRGTCTW